MLLWEHLPNPMQRQTNAGDAMCQTIRSIIPGFVIVIIHQLLCGVVLCNVLDDVDVLGPLTLESLQSRGLS
jgi:hypothetical protein